MVEEQRFTKDIFRPLKDAVTTRERENLAVPLEAFKRAIDEFSAVEIPDFQPDLS